MLGEREKASAPSSGRHAGKTSKENGVLSLLPIGNLPRKPSAATFVISLVSASITQRSPSTRLRNDSSPKAILLLSGDQPTSSSRKPESSCERSPQARS